MGAFGAGTVREFKPVFPGQGNEEKFAGLKPGTAKSTTKTRYNEPSQRGVTRQELPGAEEFGYGPGLGNAATWTMRSIRVINFGESAEPIAIDGFDERFKKGASRGAILVNAIMGESEGTEEPAPDRALMVGGIALAWSAGIGGSVTGFAGSEAAQSVWGQQMGDASVDDGFLLLGEQRADRQRDGENLIRSQSIVVTESRRG